MFIIPNWVFSLLTFPGVLLRELTIFILCKAMRINCSIGLLDFYESGATTFVIHNEVSKNEKLVIKYFPLFLSIVICSSLAYFNHFTRSGSKSEILFLWLALSFVVQTLSSVGSVLKFFWMDVFVAFVIYVTGQSFLLWLIGK